MTTTTQGYLVSSTNAPTEAAVVAAMNACGTDAGGVLALSIDFSDVGVTATVIMDPPLSVTPA